MSKIKRIWDVVFERKDPIKVASAVESVRVKALKRQIETLEEINFQYSDQVKALNSELSTRRESSMQDKIIDTVAGLFNNSISPLPLTPKPAHYQNTELTQKKLDTSTQYSDDELIQLAQSLPKQHLNHLKRLNDEDFRKILKSQIPDISNTGILRSREIINSM